MERKSPNTHVLKETNVQNLTINFVPFCINFVNIHLVP